MQEKGDRPVDPTGAHGEPAGHEQARRLKAVLDTAGIDLPRLWLRYFSIGGDVSQFEVEAYLHHSLVLPRLQRDLLGQAAHELLADLGLPQAPRATEPSEGRPDESDERDE